MCRSGNTACLAARRVPVVRNQPDPDHALVCACQEPGSDGFEPAFEALFERYQDRVYAIAYRMTGRSADAMDVVQEAFSLLLRKVGAFRSDSLFSTWLFRLVVNCSIDFLRRERSRSSGSQHLEVVDQAALSEDPERGPEAVAQRMELGGHVQDAIDRLSPKLRGVLVLRYLEGMSYDELAAALEISLGTVKSRLARAHLAIENELRGTLGGFDVAGADFPSSRAKRTMDHDRPSPGGGGPNEEGVA